MSLEMEEAETERFLADAHGSGSGSRTAPAAANGSSHSNNNMNGNNGSGSGGGFSRRTKFWGLLGSVLLAGLILSGRTDERAVDNLEHQELGDVQLKEPHHDANINNDNHAMIDDTPPDSQNTVADGAAGGTESDDDDATKTSQDNDGAAAAATDAGADADAKTETATETEPAETEPAAEPAEPEPAVTTETETTATSTTTTTEIGSTPKGFRKPAQEYSDTYLPRHKPSWNPEQLAGRWGSWTLVDANREQRPELPVADYPNGDVPRTAFPAGAWQADEPYLERFLSEGIALADRALQAILAEYGHDDPKKGGGDGDPYMFSLTLLEQGPGEKVRYGAKHDHPGNAGYASPSTLRAIRKRLLHSIVTEGTFLFVMGGHSASAGHGNLFQQSYTLQVQKVLEPVLARLGVYHKSHNFGMGGLGTAQNGVAVRSLYGANIDVLMWDSGMTENEQPIKDLFARQGLVSGDTVPVLWGRPDNALYEPAGAGAIMTGMWGTGTKGIPKTESATQVNELPYWARYLECEKEAMSLCKQSRYNATCWIPRDDGIEPGVKQAGKPGGQASWHPGNRVHQLYGRMIAYTILSELKKGLEEWRDTEAYALPDEKWHLTQDFERVRDYVRHNVTDSPCRQLALPNVVCDYPVYAVSEMTPRYNPAETSIRSIMKEGVYVDQPKPNLYDPPDVFNPAFHAPDGEVDYLSIVENGVDYVPNRARAKALAGEIDLARRRRQQEIKKRKPITSNLEPGQGWSLDTKSAPDNCDGSYDSFCGRSADYNCLLHAHNDYRGGLRFDSLSGWLIVNLAKVKHGLIFARMEHWQGPGANPLTKDWVCENGKTDCPAAKEEGQKKKRQLLGELNKYCDAWRFEFAIDGKVTSWTQDEWRANLYQAQRVVHFTRFLDDENYTGGQEKDVELAIRMTGCGRDATHLLSHIYWL